MKPLGSGISRSLGVANLSMWNGLWKFNYFTKISTSNSKVIPQNSKDIQLCLQKELGWARRGKTSLTCGRYLFNIHEMPETASVHPILAVIFMGYLLYSKV